MGFLEVTRSLSQGFGVTIIIFADNTRRVAAAGTCYHVRFYV